MGPVDEVAFQEDRRLRRVRSYVEENYSHKIRLQQAARVAALEASYFSTFFNRKVGLPFGDWLRRFRVEKAIELLKERDYSITDLASQVGFANLRTFERAFKKYTNRTPIEFKKSIRP